LPSQSKLTGLFGCLACLTQHFNNINFQEPLGSGLTHGAAAKVTIMLILRNASPLALLSAATVMCIGYAAPAGAVEKGKVVEVPASTARAMTPDQKQQAMAYARRNGIRWRIVEGK
jgi:hypothetical protein